MFKREKDLYDIEEKRLRAIISDLDPFDEKYDQAQAKLKNTIAMRESSKESKRKIAKGDRGGLIRTILSVGGGLLGGIMVAKYEKEGMMFSGEKKNFMDGMISTIGKLFFRN